MAKLGEAMQQLDPGSVTSSVREIGATLARQAEAAGERLQSLAGAFREALPTNGTAGLRETFDAATTRLGEMDLREIGREAIQLVRRYPVQTALVGAGIAYAISRVAKRRAANGFRTRLKDVMTQHVEVVGPDTSLKEASAKMADLDVGTMPVCDGERLVGMLTDRDIAVRGVARGADPSSTPVRQIMSGTVRYGFEDEPIDRAIETMRKHKIRRLPILDRDKRLRGIVALGDLAVDVGAGEAGHVLERVSEPGRPSR